MCQNLALSSIKLDDSVFMGLKRKVKLMHFFKMVHLDVKNDNIMYSSERKEAVLIDFGFSKFIEESLGNKTYTRFGYQIYFRGPLVQ